MELLLLGHTESFWQLVPLGLSVLSLIVLGWRIFDKSSRSLRTFQATMMLFILSGIVGSWLHYSGNTEFELEMYPHLQGIALVWAALKGATPTLAPGTMIVLGLIGLVYSYEHPGLARSGKISQNTEEMK